ncbi:MAG: hypothetical protein VX323_09700, partial [Pseudomonadota bacterium]|nr:hypothetical protein [Pseudomonadota bacterium]
MIADAAAVIDSEIEVGGPLQAEAEARSLIELLDALQGGEDWAERRLWPEWEAALPGPLKVTLRRILYAILSAIEARAQAIGEIDPALPLDELYLLLPNSALPSPFGRLNPGSPEIQDVLVPTARAASALYRGAASLAQGVDEAALEALIGFKGGLQFSLKTPHGWILLRGSGDDLYDPYLDDRLQEPILLLIDLGGDDTYRIPAGATSGPDHGLSLHLDLGGNDSYHYEEFGSPYDLEGLLPSDEAGRHEGDEFWGPFSLSSVARQGSGILGYGFLVDLGGGADEYRSLRYGQGFGAFGVGLLYDDGGDDRYTLEAAGQGAGVGGLGLLI